MMLRQRKGRYGERNLAEDPAYQDSNDLFRTIPVPFAVEQNHLPRPYASECAGMRVGVEGAEKSLHLPRLHALQVTPAGVSVEGDFVLGWPGDRFVHCHPNLNSDCHRKSNRSPRNPARVSSGIRRSMSPKPSQSPGNEAVLPARKWKIRNYRYTKLKNSDQIIPPDLEVIIYSCQLFLYTLQTSSAYEVC